VAEAGVSFLPLRWLWFHTVMWARFASGTCPQSITARFWVSTCAQGPQLW
jgi:hypothetical protein